MQYPAISTVCVAIVLTLYGCSGSCGQHRNNVSEQLTIEKRITSAPEPDERLLLDFIRAQLRFGPRVPGTKAHIACRQWLVETLKQAADTVFVQHFIATVYGRKYPCSNIIAQLYPDRPNRVLLCAHWDSRPTADEDPIPANRKKPVPGANDGASGVAVVLEIARLLRQHPPPVVGIDIALFDAEDMGAPTDEAMFCLGSKYFASNFPLPVRPHYGILFDLVGDHDAHFFIERTSQQVAPALVERIWSIARIYGNGRFSHQVGGSVIDDHLPLIEIGIPTVNIIDLELVGNVSKIERRRYWHTTRDDIENISSATLASVVRVVLALLYSDSPFPF